MRGSAPFADRIHSRTRGTTFSSKEQEALHPSPSRMLASIAAAPLVCHHRHQFGATAHSQQQRLRGAHIRGHHGSTTTASTTHTRRSRAASLVTPRAVSIYDAVRGDDERSASSSTAREPDVQPKGPVAPPSVSPTTARKPPVAPPVVAPTVISSKAYMLSIAEDLAEGVACDGDEEEECATSVAAEQDGIFQWTLKYVDKGLDEIEREKPKQAEVAWKAGKRREKKIFWGGEAFGTNALEHEYRCLFFSF